MVSSNEIDHSQSQEDCDLDSDGRDMSSTDKDRADAVALSKLWGSLITLQAGLYRVA